MTILVAPILNILTKSKENTNKGVNQIMGMTEILVLGFLAMLGFFAYNNSRKVSRELKKLGAK